MSVEPSPAQAPATFPNGVLVSGSAVVKAATAAQVRIRLDGENGRISLNKTGVGGEIRVSDSADNPSLWLLGNGGTISATGDVLIGPALTGVRTIELRGTAGEVSVYHYQGPSIGTQRALHFHAASARLTLGMEHNGGVLILKNPSNKDAVRIDSYPRARIEVGDVGVPGEIRVKDAEGNTQIHIDATRGDILIGNADCAEEFRVAETATELEREPGTVMVLDDDGLLRPSSKPCDHRVVGIVSGGNGREPGIVLGSGPRDVPTVRIALLGTVQCKVSAEAGPIMPGSLLTTASARGHAMAVADNEAPRGAVLGKALRGLSSGVALIPVLVMLR